MPTLNTVFKQIFAEALEPLGFKKIKGKYPYFVRVVGGGEIIHVITYRNEQTGSFDEKAFSVLGGVATVYRQSIDLTLSPQDNMNWLNDNRGFYRKIKPLDFDDDIFNKLRKSDYKMDSEETLFNAVKNSLEATKRFMLPVLNAVNCLRDCIEFYYDLCPPLLHLYEDWFGKKYGSSDESEGRLLIKANYRDDGIERLKRSQARTALLIKEGKGGYNKMFDAYNQKEFLKKCKESENHRLEQVAIRNKMLDDPVLNKRIMDELEEFKIANVQKLRSYGLDL